MSRRSLGFVRQTLRQSLLGTAVAGLVFTPTMPALGNPSGATVVEGTADFSVIGNELTVTNSPGAIIDWQAFSIAQDELTRFQQQSANSAVLNRVTGDTSSEILGSLVSNGQVFLINPNGIVFGQDVTLDTAGFVASTLDIANEDFLAGEYVFDGDGGTILNEGYLTSRGGNVFFIASDIENSGIIHTESGSLVLAAGRRVRISSLDVPDIEFEVVAPENRVLNLGSLIADQGAVRAFAGTLEHSGEIRADSVAVDEDGSIVLFAAGDIDLADGSIVDASGEVGGDVLVQSEAGTVLAAGTIDARGTTTEGGQVRLLGEEVGVIRDGSVLASGATDGGRILVGGARRGEGPEPNARASYVGSDATLAADAGGEGDGGEIIVYAEELTRVYGELSARGGSTLGDGGFIETSAQRIEVTSEPDASAPNGAGGEWLIDPDLLVIGSGGLFDVNDLGGDPNIFRADPLSNGPTIQDTLIEAVINAGTSVTLETVGSVANIIVNAQLDLASNDPLVVLTFDSTGGNGGVTVNQPIINSGTAMEVRFRVADAQTVDFNADVLAGPGGLVRVEDLSGSATSISLFDANVTFDSLFIADVVQVNAGTQNFDGGIQAFDFQINPTGVANIEGASAVDMFFIDGGTLAGSGDLDVGLNFDFNAGSEITGAGTVTLFSGISANVAGTGARTLSGSRVLRIDPGAILNWNDGDVNLDNTAAIQVAGELDINLTAADANIGFNGGTPQVSVEAGGRIDDTTGPSFIATIDVPLFNGGTVDASGFELALTRGGISGGSFSTGPGSALSFRDLSGPGHDLSGTISGMGPIQFLSGGVTTISGSYSVMDTRVIDGSVDFDVASNTQTLELDSGILGGTGELTIAQGLTWIGDGSMAGSGITRLQGSGSVINGNFTRDILDSRRLIVDSGALLSWDDGQVRMNDTSRIEVDGSFSANLGADNFISLGGGTPRVIINAGGAFDTTGAGVARFQVPVDNAGTVTANPGVGAASFERGGNSTGTFTANGAGTVLTFSDIDLVGHTLAGDLNGAGTVIIGAGGTQVVTGNINVGILDIDGSTSALDLRGASNAVTDLLLTDGTLLGTSNVDVSGTLNWEGIGELTGTSSITLLSGATGSWMGGSNKAISQDGVFVIESGASFDWLDGNVLMSDNALIAVDGTLTFNLSTARFIDFVSGTPSLLIDAGGTLNDISSDVATVDVALDNDGTVSSNGILSLDLTRGGTSTGDFDVASESITNFSDNDGVGHLLSGNLTGPGTYGFVFGGTTDITGSVSGADAFVSNGSVDFNGTTSLVALTLASGQIGGGGTIDVTGTFDWIGGGDMGGTGTTRLLSAATGNILNSTNRELLDSRVLRIDSGASIDWDAGTITMRGTSRFEVEGSLNVVGAGNTFLDFGDTNPLFDILGVGTLSVTGGGTHVVDVDTSALGTIGVNASTLEFQRSGTFAGNVGGSGNVRFNGGSHTLLDGFLYTSVGGGNLQIANGEVLVAAGNTANFDTLELAGGTVGGDGTVNITGGIFQWNAGDLGRAGDTGSLVIQAGQTGAIATSATHDIRGAYTLQNDGTLTWFDGALTLFDTAVLQNNANLSLELLSNRTLAGNATTLLSNAGSIFKPAGQTASVTIGTNVDIAGSVSVDDGTLSFSGGGDHTAVYTTNAPGTVRFTGGTHNWNAGVDFNNNGFVEVIGGEVVLNATVETDNLRLNGGTIGGNGDLNLLTTFVFESGDIGRAGDTGTTTLEAGASASIDTGGTKDFRGDRVFLNQGNLTWNDGSVTLFDNAILRNEGTLTLQTVSNRTLAGNANTLFDNTTGILNKPSGNTAELTINTPANISASVNVDDGTLIFANDATHDAVFTIQSPGIVRFAGATQNLNAGVDFTGTGFVEITAGDVLANTTVAFEQLRMTGGVLGGNGDVNLENLFEFRSGDIGRAGDTGTTTLLAPATASIDTAGTKDFRGDRIFLNQGNIDWNDGSITLFNNAIFRNEATLRLQTPSNRTFAGSATTLFENAATGDLQKNAGNAVDVTFGTPTSISGTVNVDDGTLLFTNLSNQDAVYSIAAPGLLRFAGNTQNLNAGVDFNGTGFVEISAGEVLANANLAFDNLRITGGVLGGSADVDISQGFEFRSGDIGRTGDAGTTTLLAGTTASIDTTGTKDFRGDRIFLNQTTLDWNEGTITLFDNAVFRNEAIFRLLTANNRTLSGGATTLFDHSAAGSLDKPAGNTVDLTISAPADFAGAVSVSDGALNIQGNSTIASTFTITTPGLLRFNGNQQDLNAGASFTGTGTTQVSSGTVLANALIPFDNLELLAGVLGGNGDIDIGQSFVFNGGDLGRAGDIGTTTLAPGSTGTITGTNTKDFRGDRVFLNQGTLTWNNGAISLFDNAAFRNESVFSLATTSNRFISGASTASFESTATGAIDKAAGNTVEIGISVPATIAGSLNIADGTLRLNTGSDLSATTTLTAPGVLALDGASPHNLLAGADFSGTGLLNIVSGQTLVAGGATVNTSNLDLSGGVLAGTGELTVGASFGWTGGTIGSPGNAGTFRLLSGSTGTISSGLTKNIDEAVFATDAGSALTWTAGSLNLRNNAQLNNGGTFNLDAATTLDTADATNPFIQNDGLITNDAVGGTTTIDVLLDNDGTMQASTGVISLERDGNHDGDFFVTSPGDIIFNNGVHVIGPAGSFNTDAAQTFNAQVVTIDGGFSAGDVIIENGSDITFNGTFAATTTTIDASVATFNGISTTNDLTIDNGTIRGTGALAITGNGLLDTAIFDQMAGGVIDFQPGSVVTGTGVTQNSAGADAFFSGSLNLGSLAITNGTVAVDGPMESVDSLIISGGTTFVDGGLDVNTNFVLSGGALSGMGTVSILGTGTFAGGFQDGDGNTVIESGATATATANVDLFETRFLDVRGTLTLPGATDITLSDDTVLLISSGGLVDLQADANILDGANNGGFVIGSNLDVQGELRKSGGAGLTVIDTEFTINDGLINALDGTIAMRGDSSSGGTFGADTTLRFENGIHNLLDGAALAGSGDFEIAGGTLATDSAGTATATNLALLSGSIDAQGTLNVGDFFTWNGGSIGGDAAGRVEIAPTASGTINAAVSLDTTTLAIQSGGGNSVNWSNGNITLSTGAAIDVSGVFVAQHSGFALNGSGSENLNVLGGGIFRQDGSGTMPVSLILNNAGTVDAVGGGNIAFSAGGTNTGAYTLNGGNVSITGGTLNFLPGTTINGAAGFVRVDGGTIAIDPAADVAATRFAVDAGALNNQGAIRISDEFQWTGGLIGGSAGGETQVLASAVGTFSGGAKTLDTAMLSIDSTGGVVWNNGNITMQNNAVLGIGGLLSAQHTGFALNGSSNETIVVDPGGTFEQAGSGTMVVGSSINNDGIVRATTGTVSLDGGGVSTGVFESGTGTVSFGAGLQTLAAGASITGSSTGFVDVDGGTLVIDAAANVAATRFAVRSGILDNRGALNISERFEWNGGTIGGNAGARTTVLASADGQILGAGMGLASSTLVINSTPGVVWTGGNISATTGANIEVGGLFLAQHTGFSLNGNATETLEIVPGGTFEQAGSGTLNVGIALNNDGRTLMTSGVAAFGAGGVSSGEFAVAGGELQFAGGTHTLQNGTSMTGGAGFNRVTAGNVIVNTGATIGATRFGVSGGSLDNAGTLSVTDSFEWLGGAIAGTPLGQLLIESTADGVFAGGAKTLDTSSLFVGSDMANPTLWTNGNITLANAASLNVDGVFVSQHTGFTLAGTPAETLGIAPTGVFEQNGSGTLVVGPSLVSAGLLKSESNATTQFDAFATVDGDILINAGTIFFNGSGVGNDGTYTVNAGGTLDFGAGAPFDLNNVTLAGAGTIVGNINSALSSVDGPLTFRDTDIDTVAGTLTVNDLLTLQGTVNVNGDVTVTLPGTISIEGDAGLDADVFIPNLINQGTVVVTSINGPANATLTVGGTFANIGNFFVAPGAGGARTVNGALNSQGGSVQLQTDVTLDALGGGPIVFGGTTFAQVTGGVTTVNLDGTTFQLDGMAFLDLNGGDLTLANVGVPQPTFLWSGGSIGSPGTLDASAVFTDITGGGLSLDRATLLAQDIELFGGADLAVFNGATLDVAGQTRLAGGALRIFGSDLLTPDVLLDGGNLEIGGGTVLTLQSLALNGGELNGDGQTSVTTAFDWNSGGLVGLGTLTLQAGSTANANGFGFIDGYRLENLTSLTLDQAQIELRGSGTIFNDGMLRLSGAGAAITNDFAFNGVFDQTNTASLRADAGSGGVPGPLADNAVQAGTMNLGGTVLADGVSLLLQSAGGSPREGLYEATAGGALLFAGEHDFTAASSIDAPRVELLGFGFGSINLGATLTTNALALAGNVSLPNALTIDDVLVASSQDPATGGVFDAFVTVADSLTVNNNLTLRGGTLAGPGTVVVPETATLLAPEGGRFGLLDVTLEHRSQTGQSRIASEGGDISGTATFVNDGLLELSTGPNSFMFVSGDGRFENNGAIIATPQPFLDELGEPRGGGSIFFTGAFDNAGSIELRQGFLRLNGGGVHTGSFVGLGDIQSNLAGRYRFSGDHVFTSASSVSAASLGLSAGTFDVDADLQVQSLFLFGEADVDISAGVDLELFSINGPRSPEEAQSRLRVAGDINASRQVIVSGGIISGPGSLNIGPEALFRFEGEFDQNGEVVASTILLDGRDLNIAGTGEGSEISNVTFDLRNGADIDFSGTAALGIEPGVIPADPAAGIPEQPIDVGPNQVRIVGDGTGRFRNSGSLTGPSDLLLDVDTTQGGTLGANTLGLAEGRTLTLTGGNTGASTLADLRGTTVLTGGSLSAPTIAVSGTLAGTGTVTGNVTNTGLVSPGASPGTLNVIGNFIQSPTGTLLIEIDGAGTEAGTDFDVLDVSGTATLGGTLSLATLEGFEGTLGESFSPLRFSAAIGEFAAVTQPAPDTAFDPVLGPDGLEATLVTLNGEVFVPPEPEEPEEITFDPDNPRTPENEEQARDFAEDLLTTCPEERSETVADNNTAREQQNRESGNDERDGPGADQGAQQGASQGVGCTVG